MFHSVATATADAFSSVTTYSYSAPQTVVIVTDDMPVLVELGTTDKVQVTLGAPDNVVQNKTFQVSSGFNSLKIRATCRRLSWFAQEGEQANQGLINVQLPSSGVRRLMISTKTGDITAVELPNSLNKLSVATVNSQTHILTKAAQVDYETVVGIAQIRLSGNHQRVSASDVSGRTHISHALKDLSLQLSTRGELVAPGLPIEESLSGTKSIEVDGGESASLIELSSVAGDVSLWMNK